MEAERLERGRRETDPERDLVEADLRRSGGHDPLVRLEGEDAAARDRVSVDGGDHGTRRLEEPEHEGVEEAHEPHDLVAR